MCVVGLLFCCVWFAYVLCFLFCTNNFENIFVATKLYFIKVTSGQGQPGGFGAISDFRDFQKGALSNPLFRSKSRLKGSVRRFGRKRSGEFPLAPPTTQNGPRTPRDQISSILDRCSTILSMDFGPLSVGFLTPILYEHLNLFTCF